MITERHRARHPCHVVYGLAGSPPDDRCEEMSGPCAICGLIFGYGIPYLKWQGSNFTDQTRIGRPDGTHVCAACVYCHSWTAPPGHPPEPGKKRGTNLMLWNHLWSETDGYVFCRSKDREMIATWLRRPPPAPWWAALTETGQKHTLPYAPVNTDCGFGHVLLQELVVEVGNWELYDDIAEIRSNLKDFRARADDKIQMLSTGNWSAAAMIHLGIPRVLAFENRWSWLRESPWWRLVLYLT